MRPYSHETNQVESIYKYLKKQKDSGVRLKLYQPSEGFMYRAISVTTFRVVLHSEKNYQKSYTSKHVGGRSNARLPRNLPAVTTCPGMYMPENEAYLGCRV